MGSIPFPRQIAETSARNTKRSYESRKSIGAGDHCTEGQACFRLATGETRMAYDPYDPQYPERATPGLGTVHARLRYYPNETSGYDFRVTDFVPASELLADAAPWDNPAAALVEMPNADPYLVIAPDEASLNNLEILQGQSVTRPAVEIVGKLDANAPMAAIYTELGYRKSVLVGTPGAVAEALLDRMDINKPEGDLEECQLLDEIADALRKRYPFKSISLQGEDLLIEDGREVEDTFEP